MAAVAIPGTIDRFSDFGFSGWLFFGRFRLGASASHLVFFILLFALGFIAFADIQQPVLAMQLQGFVHIDAVDAVVADHAEHDV